MPNCRNTVHLDSLEVEALLHMVLVLLLVFLLLLSCLLKWGTCPTSNRTMDKGIEVRGHRV